MKISYNYRFLSISVYLWCVHYIHYVLHIHNWWQMWRARSTDCSSSFSHTHTLTITLGLTNFSVSWPQRSIHLLSNIPKLSLSSWLLSRLFFPQFFCCQSPSQLMGGSHTFQFDQIRLLFSPFSASSPFSFKGQLFQWGFFFWFVLFF